MATDPNGKFWRGYLLEGQAAQKKILGELQSAEAKLGATERQSLVAIEKLNSMIQQLTAQREIELTTRGEGIAKYEKLLESQRRDKASDPLHAMYTKGVFSSAAPAKNAETGFWHKYLRDLVAAVKTTEAKLQKAREAQASTKAKYATAIDNLRAAREQVLRRQEELARRYRARIRSYEQFLVELELNKSADKLYQQVSSGAPAASALDKARSVAGASLAAAKQGSRAAASQLAGRVEALKEHGATAAQGLVQGGKAAAGQFADRVQALVARK